jgi:hypothetical protein
MKAPEILLALNTLGTFMLLAGLAWKGGQLHAILQELVRKVDTQNGRIGQLEHDHAALDKTVAIHAAREDE